MTDVLSYETYAPLVDSDFTICYGEDGRIEAQLAKVSDLVEKGAASYFSLFFLTEPIDGAEQGLYRVENAQTGPVDLFLVPVAQTPDGRVELQAVINKIRQVD